MRNGTAALGTIRLPQPSRGICQNAPTMVNLGAGLLQLLPGKVRYWSTGQKLR